ncbi:MAG TPA: AAA-like domain-containing protein, partial [Fimbriimonas sp.]|nr:AAA-like domain-containing protein [Fimbriimonas sp.]
MLTKGGASPNMSIRSTASFFSLGGTLPVDSPSYIARRADQEILKTLINREYALVLDSRQKGKSSLLARTASELNGLGYETIKLDLQRFGSTLSAEQWYATMLFASAEQLNDSSGAKQFWAERDSMGAGERWIQYLENRATQSEKGLIVFIDEIDYVRSLPFDTDELFALIRSSFNHRSESKLVEKLSFCFSGASSPAGLVRNPDNGQMIIGRRIQLDDFRFEEIAPYASMLASEEGVGFSLLRKIYSWTNGHPYLT